MASDLSHKGARAALHALYQAKIEATRRDLPKRDVADAVRALLDDRAAALRALADRTQAAFRALRERRVAARFSARLARQVARRDEARPR